jgi:hypothetical protein
VASQLAGPRGERSAAAAPVASDAARALGARS